jgi:hypothetical protein
MTDAAEAMIPAHRSFRKNAVRLYKCNPGPFVAAFGRQSPPRLAHQ